MKLNGLLIGCGNIGALYDFDNQFILTHAKAFSLYKEKINYFVTDIDSELADKIADKYSFNNLNYNEIDNYHFDFVSIATPTYTHFDYLSKYLTKNVSLIICEKPICGLTEELDNLKKIKFNSSSKIFINYFRRTIPEFIFLKKEIEDNYMLSDLRNIIIKYNRGFLNNGSHALDLIQFLFDKKIEFLDLIIFDLNYKFSNVDPTVSASFKYFESKVQLIGFNDDDFSIFEIELYFKNQLIKFINSGDEIQKYVYNEEQKKFELYIHLTNLLEKRMMHVAEHCFCLNNDNLLKDNFNESMLLNEQMLNVIKKIQ